MRKLMAVALLIGAGCAGPPRLTEEVVQQRRQRIESALKEGETQEALNRYRELVNESGRGVFPNILVEIATAILYQGVADQEPARRISALGALDYADVGFAIEAAVMKLRDRDPSVRTAAVDALRRAGRPRTISFIRSQLKEEPPGGRQVIETALQRDYERLHTHVRWALAALGDDRQPIGPLVRSMSSAAPDIRAAAAAALGELGKRDALPSLRYGLDDDIEWLVNRASAEALRKLGERGLVGRFAQVAAARPEPRRVVWAMDIRQRYDLGPSRRWILEVGTYRREPEIRQKAAEVLGRLRMLAAEPRLKEMLDQFEANVRAAAAYALVRLCRKSFDTLIVKAADAPEPEVRVQAVGYLAEIDPACYREVIASRLQDPDAAVRLAAVRAYDPLNAETEEQQIPPLIALSDLGGVLKDADSDVRFTAAALIRCVWLSAVAGGSAGRRAD